MKPLFIWSLIFITMTSSAIFARDINNPDQYTVQTTDKVYYCETIKKTYDGHVDELRVKIVRVEDGEVILNQGIAKYEVRGLVGPRVCSDDAIKLNK